MEFINTKERLPLLESWVIGQFSRQGFCTCRYVASEEKWQLWDYSWSKYIPVFWIKIPEDFVNNEFSQNMYKIMKKNHD